ncbi:O-antigen ligase family protein [Gordonia soli]|uniref:O-antigen ligase-related domain-containing protein n=1 Tax=Gordonia soli NBRC 108243 TaxID=1223545 RepID=M0QLK8_9ACTN|nr:O-antigen ligase family protein [Gordonia soli]GAC69191.1 hypothetical protein GS4_22_00230 [Gordonia soli NBRC 108243]
MTTLRPPAPTQPDQAGPAGSAARPTPAWIRWYRDPRLWAGTLAVMSVALLAMRQSFLLRGSRGLTPMQATILLGVVLLIAGIVFGGQRVPAPPLIPSLLVIGVLMIVLMSYAAAAARGMTAAQQAGADRSLTTQVLSCGAFFLLVTVIRTRTAVIWILRGLVIGGTLSALYALLQTAIGFDIAPHMRIPVLLKADVSTLVSGLMRAGSVRPQGAAGHPLELSAVLSALVPIAVGITSEAHSRRERWWPWAVMGTILAVGALTTVSRSAIVGMAVAAVVLALYSPIRRAVVGITSIGVVVGGAWVVQLPLFTRLNEVFTSGSNDNSLGSRSFGANWVSEHYVQFFWLGQGPGTYDLNKQPVLDNEYLSRLMEVGVLGLLGFITFIAVGVVASQRATFTARRGHDRGFTDLCAGVAGAVAAIGVIAIVLDIGGFAQISTMLTLLVPLSVCLARIASEAPEITPVGDVAFAPNTIPGGGHVR